MNVPSELLYTKEHEWVLVDGDVATIGITDHAQAELGDVVYVELPEAGRGLEAHESFGSVESVKAVSEIFTPVGGSVNESNGKLVDSPEIVNSDPYGEGWMVRLTVGDKAELNGLMDADAYRAYLAEEH